MVGFEKEDPEIITEAYRQIEGGDVESLQEIQHNLGRAIKLASRGQKPQFRVALLEVKSAILQQQLLVCA